MSKTIQTVVAVLLMSTSLSAQSSWATLLYSEGSGQYQFATDIDTSTRVTVSTGGISSFFSNSISLNDISTVEGNVRTIDFDIAKGKIKSNNDILTETNLDLIHIDYRLRNGYLRGGYGYRSFVQIGFNEGLFNLIADGNEQYIGQSVSFGPELHMGNFNQIYLGYQGTRGSLSYTIQGKFLSGLGHLQTNQSSLVLETSDDIYQVKFINNYELQTSRILKYNSVEDVAVQFSNLTFSKPFKGNYGYGFDFGLSYKTKKGHRFFANIYDVGTIHWTNLTRTYSTSGTVSYEGLDVVDFFNSGDNISVIDSLRSLLEVDETLDNFSSTLPMQFVLGLDYQFKNKTSFSLIFSGTEKTNSNAFLVGLFARKKFSKRITVGISYAYIEGIHAVGVHGALKIGSLRIIAATDQLPSIFRIASSRIASGRIGVSYSI